MKRTAAVVMAMMMAFAMAPQAVMPAMAEETAEVTSNEAETEEISSKAAEAQSGSAIDVKPDKTKPDKTKPDKKPDKKKNNKSTKPKKKSVRKKQPKKTVYLTFDDGPGSKVTPQLLKVLKKNKVKATFFIVGTQAKGHEKLLRQIVKDGHTLAIHTYTHDFRKIYASKKAYLDDFHKTEKLIKDATGVQPHYFRFPGGGNNHYMSTKMRNEILRELHKEGYTEMDWNCGTSDAAPTYYSEAQLIRYGKTSHWGSDPIVLLQHDWNAKYHTPAVTDALIRYYRAKGYHFNNLDHYDGPEMCFKRK